MDLYHYSSIHPHAIVLQQDTSPFSVTLVDCSGTAYLTSCMTTNAQTALQKNNNHSTCLLKIFGAYRTDNVHLVALGLYDNSVAKPRRVGYLLEEIKSLNKH